MRLDHPGLVTLKLSEIQILWEHLELAREQSAVDLKSVGKDRRGREGKVKEFRGHFFIYRGCTFETSRPMVLPIGRGESQDQERCRDCHLQE